MPDKQKNALTFDELLPKNQPLYKAHEQQGPVTFKDMTPKERVAKFGAIEEWTVADDLKDKTWRFSNVAEKAVLGDIPFVRKLLPESVQKTTPQTPSEKVITPLLSTARDIAVYGGAGKLLRPLTKLELLGKTARVAAKTISEAVKGGATGALSADSEDPIIIAKKSGIYGGISAGTVPAVEAVSWAGSKVVNALGRSDKLGAISEWLGLSLRENSANNLVRQRYGDINSRLIKSEKYIDDLSKQITPDEDRALAHLVESGGVFKKGAVSPKVEAASKSIREYLDKAHAELVRDYGKDVGFIKNYVPHIWDIPKNKEKKVVDWFVTRNPHLQKRRIDTIEEGVKKFGLTPKYDKATDLLRVYDQMRIKSSANLKFVNDLKGLETEGVKLVQRADKAPANWPVIDHPAVRRSMGRYIGTGEDKKLVLSNVPIRVHPSIYKDVKTVLDTYDPGKAARIIDTANTFVKQSVLNLSLFHHTALTETAIAAGMGKEAIKAWNPVKIYKAFKNGTYKAALQDDKLAQMAVKDGLNIGAISDVEGGRTIVAALKTAEKNLKGDAIALGIKTAIRKPLEFNNKFLWDYLHTTYKLQAYSKLKSDMVRSFPNKPTDVIGKEVAQFVNDTFGGQPWEIMAKSKQWRQFSRFVLLSPDWVLSTMKQAVSPFGVGAASAAGKEIRKEMGKDFWRRAIIYFGGSMNILNHAYTKAHTGKGRYMWDNPPGKETYLFTGHNPDGTERYLRWGKQFRELSEAINKPTEIAGRKVSPLVRIGKHQIWPDQIWQKEISDNPFWSKAGLAARGTQLLKDVTPYSITQQQRIGSMNPLSFAMPISRGMTPSRARKFFRMAIVQQDKELAKRVFAASLNNEIDPEPIFKQAVSAIKSEKKFEARIDAYKIVQEYRSLGYEEGKLFLERLEIDGTLTPLIKEQVVRILKSKAKVKSKKEAFDKLMENGD